MATQDVFTDAVARMERIAARAGIQEEVVDALRQPLATLSAVVSRDIFDQSSTRFDAMPARLRAGFTSARREGTGCYHTAGLLKICRRAGHRSGRGP